MCPDYRYVQFSHTMQPLDRQSLPIKNRRTSPATSGELDPLLQFEPEDPGVGRREHAAMSVRPSSISPSMRGGPAARPQRKIELPPVPRPKARRPLWTVVVSATCGSVLVAVILMQITAPSSMASPKAIVSPRPAPTPTATAVPVERSTDTTPLVPVSLGKDKEPVAPVRVEPRSRGTDALVLPSSTGSRPVAGTRFYGSLAIDSIPVGARVFINNEPVGVTPLVLAEIPVGSRAVRLEADDHALWSSTIRVVAGQQAHLRATLSPSR
jgi:hypothetical protein